MEEFNLRVFLMVTHSVAGALPLAIVITSDEQTQTLIDALDFLKSSLPSYAFYKRGADTGPAVIMTDNCSELRDAILHTWPQTTNVLCIFHILQQVWRWLHDGKNSIYKIHCPNMLLLFKTILYAESEDDMESRYEELMDSEIVSKYPGFKNYVRHVYSDRSMWALCYRAELPISGNNTNNYIEAQFLVIKDEVLGRQKEVNVVGLLDKLTNELDSHYKNKLLSVSSGKFDGIYSRRFKGITKRSTEGIGYNVPSIDCQKTIIENVESLGRNTFLVKSFTKDDVSYVVDMASGLCECMTGLNGSSCKHQYILWSNKISDTSSFLPIFSKEERRKYAEIAIGDALPLAYYEGLHENLPTMTYSPPLENQIEDSDDADDITDIKTPSSSLTPRLCTLDYISQDECKNAVSQLASYLNNKIESNDQNFMRVYEVFRQGESDVNS